jgi:PAS domain S-box-containing protein
MGVSVYMLILIISALLSGMLAFYTLIKRKSLKISSLAGLLFSVSLWSFASAFELAVNSLYFKEIFTIICYVGITTIPVWFFFFSAEYCGLSIFKKVNLLSLFWILPLISIVLLITNDAHHLFYSESKLSYAHGIAYHHTSFGFWWWINLTYSYLLIMVSIALLIRQIMVTSKAQKSAIKLIILSTFVPLVANMLYVSGFRPLSFIDLTPVAFSVSGLLFFWGIYSQKLFNVKPIGLNTLFNNLPDGIIMIDKEERVIDINQSGVAILNLRNNFFNGANINSILPYSFDFSSPKALHKIHLFEQNNKFLESVHSDIKNEYGQVIGYLVVIKDVTERRKSEKQLRSATDRFELAVMAAGFDPWENNLITGERNGGVKIYKDLGYADDEIPTTVDGIYKLIHPEDLDSVMQSLQDHFDGKTEIYSADFRVRDKKGNYQWVANYARVVERDKTNRALRFIGLTLNINDRKQVEDRVRKKNDELIRANAEKDKFFSIIAHDLKGPFQGFIGLTEFMSERIDEMSVDQMQDITKTLQVTAKNLYELLDNLLNWALVKRGHKRFNPEKIKVYPIVQIVMDMFLSQNALKRILIQNNIDENVVIIADKESLKTILRNLISNAIKFTPEGGSISLTSKIDKKGFVEFSITDSGIGMPEKIRDNLFKIDQKVSRPGTNLEPSTGLGLILCKELVEKHGGKIWVASSEGEGSQFTFSLPQAV